MSTGSRTKHQKSLFLVAQVSNLSSLPSLNILATFFLTQLYTRNPETLLPSQLRRNTEGKRKRGQKPF